MARLRRTAQDLDAQHNIYRGTDTQFNPDGTSAQFYGPRSSREYRNRDYQIVKEYERAQAQLSSGPRINRWQFWERQPTAKRIHSEVESEIDPDFGLIGAAHALSDFIWGKHNARTAPASKGRTAMLYQKLKGAENADIDHALEKEKLHKRHKRDPDIDDPDRGTDVHMF
jgi:hypothetical protein